MALNGKYLRDEIEQALRDLRTKCLPSVEMRQVEATLLLALTNLEAKPTYNLNPNL